MSKDHFIRIFFDTEAQFNLLSQSEKGDILDALFDFYKRKTMPNFSDRCLQSTILSFIQSSERYEQKKQYTAERVANFRARKKNDNNEGVTNITSDDVTNVTKCNVTEKDITLVTNVTPTCTCTNTITSTSTNTNTSTNTLDSDMSPEGDQPHTIANQPVDIVESQQMSTQPSSSPEPELELEPTIEIDINGRMKKIKPKKSTTFIPPTYEQVKVYADKYVKQDYFKKYTITVDTERIALDFIDYYSEREWKTGRDKMKK